MPAVESNMVPLGTRIPEFQLKDVISDKFLSLNDFINGKPILIMFICNHCPYVMHIIEKLVEITNAFIQKVNIIAINPNDYTAYPEDNPIKMKEYAKKFGYGFPYLIDETQEITKKFNASCTPDFFLYDADLKLIYRGQFDDSRPSNNIPITGGDLKKALEYSVAGKLIDFEQKPSIGCSIKWKN